MAQDDLLTIQQLDSQQADFATRFDQLLCGSPDADAELKQTVAAIIDTVKQNGDAALVDYSQRFDQLSASSMADLAVPLERCHAALQALPAEESQALHVAAQRIRDYHQHQVAASWSYTEADGTVLGQQITAIERVGIYVPGGQASYPSSVLMNAIPAQLAGVEQIIMTVPAPKGVLDDRVLAAAALAGVHQVWMLGGAQAIAALTFGTQTIPRVDKIVGPGNRYVAAAKRQVFGYVGLDMVAGPSEIVIISDGTTDPDWLAMDLCAQAEHDAAAQAVLISPDSGCLQAVNASLQRLLPSLTRRAIIRTSLQERGALIRVNDLSQAIELSNRMAPEHLELCVTQPDVLLPHIRHAGAIFMGHYSAEVMGDYCAGPNHVLPTAGTARFSSPLGVYDFQKRSSIIHCSPQGAKVFAETAAILAKGEGLQAHAQSALYRGA